MDALTTLLLGALVAGITQGMKALLPKVNPLLWVAVLALIGGACYGFIFPLVPAEMVEKAGFSFTVAVGLYETLKGFYKAVTK